MNKFDEKHMAVIRQIISWLVAGDYKAIEAASHGVRLSAELLRDAVADYGKKLITPPDFNIDKLDIVEITNSTMPSWSINIVLWTLEEGRSDLTLECTVIERDIDKIDIEVDNLHVL